MAIILEFRNNLPRPEPPPLAEGLGRMAEIVFFPGVRYERPVEETPVKPKKSRRRRDTIELED